MRRPRSLKRKIKTRRKKRKIFLFSEGKNTEPLYFKAYELAVASSVVEVVCEAKRGVPKTLLELAKEKIGEVSSRKYQKENGKSDQVWVAFDQDDHDDVPGVLLSCRQQGIGVAYSNPCFEVWLILHKESYDKDEHRSLTQKRCEEICDGYSMNNGKTPSFSQILDHVQDAEKRADALSVRRDEDGASAPKTTVQCLTREMRKPT